MKVEIMAMDKEFITPRTGTHKVTGTAHGLPVINQSFMVHYDKGQARSPNDPSLGEWNTPSPGVYLYITKVEKVKDWFYIWDHDNRRFRIRILEE